MRSIGEWDFTSEQLGRAGLSAPMVAQSAAMRSSTGVNLSPAESGGGSVGQAQPAATVTIRMAQARRLPSSSLRRFRFE